MSTKSMSFSKRLFAGILLSASLLLFGTFAGTSSAAALGDERDVSVESDITAASAVTLDNTDVKMKVGKTAALTAAVTPPDAADKTVTWSSSNTSVASVTNTGVVTAVSEGTADITASSNGSTAKCKITVMAAPLKNTSVVSKAITLGDTINISASASGGTAPYKYTYYYK